MDCGANKTPVEVIEKVRLEVLPLKTFILVLMGTGKESHGKSLIS